MNNADEENNVGTEQNGHSFSSASSAHSADYFLIGRGADKSILLNETSSSNSYALIYLPISSLVRGTFKNKRILFNGSFSYEINDFFQHSIDNEHTLYTIHDLKKLIRANGGSTEELAPFLGYAFRLVIETPLVLGGGTEGREKQRQGKEEDGTEGAENGKKKEQKSGDDDGAPGGGSEFADDDEDSDDDSLLTTLFDSSVDSLKKCGAKRTKAATEGGAFSKFVKTIVNNLIDWGSDRHRGRSSMMAESEPGSNIRRVKFCAKLRLKIGTEWRWEEHFFDELANNNTGEVLRIVRVPIPSAESGETKFVLNDVFILRCARDEISTLPTDLDVLFAESQFDCRVLTVENPSAKIANFL